MNGWDKDGSGLRVRRVRGKTLSQSVSREYVHVVRKGQFRWRAARAAMRLARGGQ
jgi:hypothetical protein